jgi:hypothetical protein
MARVCLFRGQFYMIGADFAKYKAFARILAGA